MIGSNNIPELHIVQHQRRTVVSTPKGPKEEITDLGEKRCTINPDAEFQTRDFSQYNQQRIASIYFRNDPQTKALDELVVVATLFNGVEEEVTNGAVYRVESQLNFGQQNRVWRVRATERESLQSDG